MKTPKNTLRNAMKLAAVFSRCLAEGLTPEEWQARRADQLIHQAKGHICCTSHDWCDANMVMMDAFEKLDWRHPIDITDETGDCTKAWDGPVGQLMRKAWDIATTVAWDADLLEEAVKLA